MTKKKITKDKLQESFNKVRSKFPNLTYTQYLEIEIKRTEDELWYRHEAISENRKKLSFGDGLQLSRCRGMILLSAQLADHHNEYLLVLKQEKRLT